ncbi:hypothetical protein ACQ4PT_026675 [Festuca glaucescens]
MEDGVPTTRVILARHSEYVRVAISPAAEVTACTVLIVRGAKSRLSYARPGDKGWTLLSGIRSPVADILYNERDGLFYILHFDGSVFTSDLNGPKPSLTMILHPVVQHSAFSLYLALTASDLFAEDDNQVHTEAVTNDTDIQVPQLVDHVEVKTTELVVFKVDVKNEKLVELRDIGDQALFLGFNASICLPTKDFSVFKPNCAYLTDDCEYSKKLRSDRGIWNIKKRSMEKLDDVWACFHSCLALPAPIWITPRF